MTSFPTLYDISSTLKKKQWDISVVNTGNMSIIVTNTGYTGGKITKFEKEIKNGKNLGKINATTHYTQAISEAKSKWNKKKDSGYSENLDGIKLNKNEEIILPMLALDYHKRGHDIKFPCFVQPKLDGIRGIFHNGALYSRKGKKFPHLDHINDEMKKLGVNFDGELYTKDITFQEISGIVRKKKMTPGDIETLKKVKFTVYDIVSPLDYSERLKTLESIFSKNKFKNLILIKTEICKEQNQLKKIHDNYVKQGYEGLIIRNRTGPYIKKTRSKDLQKYKEFDDAEFKITGYTNGTGKEKDLIIFTCVTKKGQPFDVRPIGAYNIRADMLKNAKKFIGKKLTVKYFGLTNDGIPRIPVGLGVRDYE